MQANAVHNASVLMADVDGLKSINDRLGHAAGMNLLRNTGRVLARCFRLVEILLPALEGMSLPCYYPAQMQKPYPKCFSGWIIIWQNITLHIPTLPN